MALYLVGDVQGCDAALGRLLQTLAFSPSRDRLILLGDLVNRGPDSLAVLRRVRALQGSAVALLGNHDLHLLAVAAGVRQPGRRDTLQQVLTAADRPQLLDWLRQRPLAWQERGVLMVHAGLLPQWTRSQALALAAELEQALRAPDCARFLQHMYGDAPRRWNDDLRGHDRLRVICNALTRLRFCTADGSMDFSANGPAQHPPPGAMPWFDVPGRRSADGPVAFGHWSALGFLQRSDLLCLDSGCVWGGALTAVRLDEAGAVAEVVRVPCPQILEPGLS